MSDELLSQAEIEALMQAAQSGPVPAESPAPQPQMVDSAPEPAAVNFAPQPVIQMQNDSVVRPMEFTPLNTSPRTQTKNGVDLILDVQLSVAVELGRASMKVKDVLGLGPGSVVELDKHAGEPVEVVVNNKVVARGEVVVIDENFGVRITEIVNASERDSYNVKAA